MFIGDIVHMKIVRRLDIGSFNIKAGLGALDNLLHPASFFTRLHQTDEQVYKINSYDEMLMDMFFHG